MFYEIDPPNNEVAANNFDSDTNHITTTTTETDAQTNDNNRIAMALTLNEDINDLPLLTLVKECVRTSCLDCLYCSNALYIAVNGKQLILHLLENHRYKPIKINTWQQVISKLRAGIPSFENVYLNTESFISSTSADDGGDPVNNEPFAKLFVCFQCFYVANHHKELYLHKRKVHQKNTFICAMCTCNFTTYSELFCHLCPGAANNEAATTDGRLAGLYFFPTYYLEYRCCICGIASLPSAFRLMVHLRKAHKTCDICLEVNEDTAKLNAHLKKHKVHHSCYKCGIAYRSKVDINKHLFWKHGMEGILCKKCLQKKWPYIYHYCTVQTAYTCEECDAVFSKPNALTVHKRFHTDDYVHACDECDRSRLLFN